MLFEVLAVGSEHPPILGQDWDDAWLGSPAGSEIESTPCFPGCQQSPVFFVPWLCHSNLGGLLSSLLCLISLGLSLIRDLGFDLRHS